MGLQWLDEVQVFAYISAAIRAQTAGPGKQRNHQWITGLEPRADVTEEPFWMSDSKFSVLRLAYRASRSEDLLGGGDGSRSASLTQQLGMAKTFDESRSLVLDALAVKISDVLMKSTDDVSPNLSMASYGLDSLVAVEFRNWIARELDVKVSMFDLVSGNSLEQLAVVIVMKSKVVRKEIKEGFKEGRVRGGEGRVTCS